MGYKIISKIEVDGPIEGDLDLEGGTGITPTTTKEAEHGPE